MPHLQPPVRDAMLKEHRGCRNINLFHIDFRSSIIVNAATCINVYSSSSKTGSFLILPLGFFFRPSLDPSFFHAETSFGAPELLLHGLSRLCCGVPGGVMTEDVLEAGPPSRPEALSSFTENRLIGRPLFGVYIDAGAAVFEADRLCCPPPPDDLPLAAACIEAALGLFVDCKCAPLLLDLRSAALGRSCPPTRRLRFSSECVCGSLSLRNDSSIDSSISSRTFSTLNRNTFASGGTSASGICAS